MRRLEWMILWGCVGAVAIPLLLGFVETRIVPVGAEGGPPLPFVSMFVGAPVGLVAGACFGAWWSRRGESGGRRR